MRWLLAAGIGVLCGVVYLLFFLSRADLEPLVVFAVVGALVAALDALAEMYVSRRKRRSEERAPRSGRQIALRSIGMFAITFVSAIAVNVLFLLQMAP
jgi:amino acid transporter